MPKLEGIETKYFNGYKIDKENDNVIYNDEKHLYLDKNTNQKYISVTSLIHLYTHEFDENFWGSYKALESILDNNTFNTIKPLLLKTKKFLMKYVYKFNIDEKDFLKKKEEIIEGYHKKRDDSCERGTSIHAMFENSFYNKTKFNLTKYGLDIKGTYDCKKNYYKLDLKDGIYPEFLVSLKSKDNLLAISGQIDLLAKDDNDISLIDWKTSNSIDKKSYYDKSKNTNETMKYPLNNIMDSNYWHYSLQLSTYAYLLQQINPKFNIKKLVIYHIDHEGKETPYIVDYLKNDVERMLIHYKKQLKINSELELDKPFKIE